MRFLFHAYSPSDPIYFGNKVKERFLKDSWLFGGSGYAISNKALRLFVDYIQRSNGSCDGHLVRGNEHLGVLDSKMEDITLCICMKAAGVIVGDGRDVIKRERFLHQSPRQHLFPNPKRWFKDSLYYKTDEGFNFISNFSISFHHIKPKNFYTLYYLVYYLQVYGIKHRYPPPPQKLNFSQVEFTLKQERKDLTFR